MQVSSAVFKNLVTFHFQQPTLSDMTQYELTFAYEIESMMSVIAHPEYRQILVEVKCF